MTSFTLTDAYLRGHHLSAGKKIDVQILAKVKNSGVGALPVHCTTLEGKVGERQGYEGKGGQMGMGLDDGDMVVTTRTLAVSGNVLQTCQTYR